MAIKLRSLASSFRRWLRTNGGDLLHEIEVKQRRHRVNIDFKRFPELRGSLSRTTISVAAMQHGVCFDFVFDRDVKPVEESEGWYCQLCPERSYFPLREALWVDHLFEPFAEWVLGPLKEMNCVEFIDQGATWVRLHPDREVPGRIVGERDRYRQERPKLELTLTKDELYESDRAFELMIEEIWSDFRMPVDVEQLERESLAALGPEGVEYILNLRDEDFVHEYDTVEALMADLMSDSLDE